MSTSEADQTQPLLQPREDDVECQNETPGMEGKTMSTDVGQFVLNFKQLKSFNIMKSALTIFTSNTKLMFLMIFSIIPFFVFVLFFEIKLQKAIVALPDVKIDPNRTIVLSVVYDANGTAIVATAPEVEYDMTKEEFLFNILQLCVLYLIVYPLLELVSMATTIQIAAKVYAGEKPSTFKEVFYRKNNLKGVLISCGCVQLLSAVTFLGLIWVFVNHRIFTFGFFSPGYWPSSTVNFWHILSVIVHTIVFVALLYKYLDWSSSWNTTMVISVLEEETGLDAFGMAGYYGKHHKPTGFQLMLGFFLLNIILRLPCLYVYGGSSNSSVAGVTSVVIGFVCLTNLVKWVAFVLYYFDCKQQTMEKKNDKECWIIFVDFVKCHLLFSLISRDVRPSYSK